MRKLRVDKKRYIPVDYVVSVSDEHCGDRAGLIDPNIHIRLDNGGWYEPSPLQLQIWEWWTEFWDEWVPSVTRGKPFAIVNNGDALEGVHHNATHQISQNLADQLNIARPTFQNLAERANGRLYFVRGTPAHGGESAYLEETLARECHAVPDENGNYAAYELWKLLGHGTPNECTLLHFMHHIGTTSAAAYESTAPHRELVDAFYEAGRWNERPPDVIVRAHRHRYARTEIPTDDSMGCGMATAIVTPGWQGKTPFTYKIPGGRQAVPQFGGAVFCFGQEESYIRRRVWNLRRPAAI